MNLNLFFYNSQPSHLTTVAQFHTTRWPAQWEVQTIWPEIEKLYSQVRLALSYRCV